MCTVRTMNAKLDKLAALKAEMKVLEAEVKKLEDFIKSEMGDDEILETGKYVVKFTRYQTSRFDAKGFTAKFPEVAASWTKTTEARRFSWAAN